MKKGSAYVQKQDKANFKVKILEVIIFMCFSSKKYKPRKGK